MPRTPQAADATFAGVLVRGCRCGHWSGPVWEYCGVCDGRNTRRGYPLMWLGTPFQTAADKLTAAYRASALCPPADVDPRPVSQQVEEAILWARAGDHGALLAIANRLDCDLVMLDPNRTEIRR